MCRHGLLADDELRRNLLLSAALDKQIQDLDLATRELWPAILCAGDFAPRDLAIDEAPYPCDELVGVEGLDDEVVSPDQQSGDTVKRLRSEAGEEEDAPVVSSRISYPARLSAAAARARAASSPSAITIAPTFRSTPAKPFLPPST